MEVRVGLWPGLQKLEFSETTPALVASSKQGILQALHVPGLHPSTPCCIQVSADGGVVRPQLQMQGPDS